MKGVLAKRGVRKKIIVQGVAGLIEAGRVKVYSVDSYDAASWCDPNLPLEARATQHGRFEDWILNQVVPFIHDDCQGPIDVMVTGASFGAFHAANFAFRRADLFPLAICQSGVYDAGQMGWGERGDAVYFNNPMDYVANLGGDHLDWLRGRLSLLECRHLRRVLRPHPLRLRLRVLQLLLQPRAQRLLPSQCLLPSQSVLQLPLRRVVLVPTFLAHPLHLHAVGFADLKQPRLHVGIGRRRRQHRGQTFRGLGFCRLQILLKLRTERVCGLELGVRL